MTNTRGEIVCDVCSGDGKPCDICGDRGVVSCFAYGCDKPASIYGANPSFAYCSIAHAFDDDEWPACLQCRAEPQDPLFGCYCGATCETAAFGAIHAARLKRWRADLAAQVGE